LSTEIKSKSLEFIDYLRSTDEYRSVLERFKEYLKTAEWDRYHVIVFDFDGMDFEFGEVFHVCDRTDNIVTLCHGSFFREKLEITEDKYE
jgi:pyruvate/2-oxoacid:ferredoxin oxidoreductase beta subunit